MLISLVDALRCTNAHADTWLVASIDSLVERDIREGTLGCPTCGTEYVVRDGVVIFDEAIVRAPFHPPREDDAMRVAAALELVDARMTAVLHGEWGAHAQLIRGLSPVQLLLVNPPDGVASGDGISIVVASIAPVAHGSMQAAAMDATATPAMAESLRTALAGGGRMIGPVDITPSDGFDEIARDDQIWVAVRQPADVASAPVGIKRRER